MSPRRYSSTMKIYKNPHVPLTRELEDGTVEEALCWCIDGDLHVHPDRWDLFMSYFRRSSDQ